MPGLDPEEYAAEHTQVVTLGTGAEIVVRPIVPADRTLLVEGFERLSAESRWQRFLRPMTRLTESELRYLTEIDYVDHFAWVALTSAPVTGVGVARYVRDPVNPVAAEAAVVVADEWQGHGVGTILLELLALTAAQRGIEVFRAFVLPSNTQAKDLMAGLGARGHHADGMWVCELDIPTPASPIRGTELYGVLAAVAAGHLDLEPPPAAP